MFAIGRRRGVESRRGISIFYLIFVGYCRDRHIHPMAIDIILIVELIHHIAYCGSCLPNIGSFYTSFHSREITKISIRGRSSMLESSGKHYLSITIASTYFLAYSYLGVRLIRRRYNRMGKHYRGGQGTVLIGNSNHIASFYLIGGLMHHRIIKRTKPKLIVAIYDPVGIYPGLWKGIGIGELFWKAWEHYPPTLYLNLKVIGIELITGYLIGITCSIWEFRCYRKLIFATVGTGMCQVKSYGLC